MSDDLNEILNLKFFSVVSDFWISLYCLFPHIYTTIQKCKKKKTVSTKILHSTTVFNIYNNKEYFLTSK